jgi:hypothetical protein
MSGDARGVRRVHYRLHAMQGVEGAGFVAAHPSDVGMGSVTRTDDQAPQVML